MVSRPRRVTCGAVAFPPGRARGPPREPGGTQAGRGDAGAGLSRPSETPTAPRACITPPRRGARSTVIPCDDESTDLLSLAWAAYDNRRMDAKIDRDGTIIVLSLEGAIDVASAPQLKAQFDQLLAHAAPKLLVDLGRVPYIDSYGLGIIMQAVKIARRSGGDVRLCAPCQDVRTILDITGFSKHLSIVPSRNVALSSWGGEAKWSTDGPAD